MKTIIAIFSLLILVRCSESNKAEVKPEGIDNESVQLIISGNGSFAAWEITHDSVVYIVTSGSGTAIIKHKDLRKHND